MSGAAKAETFSLSTPTQLESRSARFEADRRVAERERPAPARDDRHRAYDRGTVE